MGFVEVAPLKIVRAGTATLTYETETDILPGQLVTISVGSKTLTGLVMSQTKKPTYATKPIVSIIEEKPLPAPLVSLAEWLSDYYQTPLATVLQTLLPRGLTTKRRQSTSANRAPTTNRTKNVLNSDQQKVVDSILEKASGTTLLQGITGSGKTEVYREVAQRTIEAGRSVILLVPEIGLTRQVIEQLAQHFPDALLTHSQLTEAQRHLVWREALNSDKPRIVIGPRSALFLPLQDVGAIIVDEAHEPGYKQEQAPRYSALRVASVLGALHKARIVFGSATPLVAERFIAEASGVPPLRLDTKARKDVVDPHVELVDMTQRDNTSSHRFFSKQLINQIEQTLAAKEQVLLFHNRRGSAAATLCEACGWTALCERCYVPLSLHEDTFRLSCHICGTKQSVPTACPVCGAADIIHKGVGTKRIESELRRLFPHATIARFDSDNKQDETVEARYTELYDGSIDIIVGTQVVAKGLDLPHLQTVGVIQADGGLALPDYIAAERTFQLLAQVVGRVGRDSRDTTVVIQTYQPTHPVIRYGVTQDYDGFYEYQLEERRRAGFPPYRYLLQLTTVYKTEAGAIKAARTLAGTLRAKVSKDVEILGPTPAFYERQHGTYRWQLILKSPVRKHLTDALQYVPTTNWQSELDPASLL